MLRAFLRHHAHIIVTPCIVLVFVLALDGRSRGWRWPGELDRIHNGLVSFSRFVYLKSLLVTYRFKPLTVSRRIQRFCLRLRVVESPGVNNGAGSRVCGFRASSMDVMEVPVSSMIL